ncbi:MAG: hypothetical protein Q8K62_03570 [Thiobacillus sp.]|nr:hypothetical protein [Thiobacillus sp.]
MKTVANFFNILCVFLGMNLATICSASEYTGPIKEVWVDNVSGATRVLISVNPTKYEGGGAFCETAVQGNNQNARSFFYFEMPENDSKSRAWFSQLQIAKSLGKNIHISGAGTCGSGFPIYEAVFGIQN